MLQKDVKPLLAKNFLPERCKVLIVGSGPAGLATALFLLKLKPSLAGHVVALEKRQHPRPKVCAGGLIPKTQNLLAELGLKLAVPSVEVRRGRAITEAGIFEHERQEALCYVVRRDEFDGWLAQEARQRGLLLCENTPAEQIVSRGRTMLVITPKGCVEADVLVGADGSSSKVRATLFGGMKKAVGRALVADVPVDPAVSQEFASQLYKFDFRCVGWNVSGYAWAFPCLIRGLPHLNLGIYEQAPSRALDDHKSRAELERALWRAFPEHRPTKHGAGRTIVRSAPIRWYDWEQRFVSGQTLLVGDAAGVDPMMGEGISVAFEHGKLAANAIARFLDGDRAALSDYDAALHQGAIGHKLARLALAARLFYGPRHKLLCHLLALSRSAREIALDWYNGVRQLDERPLRRFVLEWLRDFVLRSRAKG